MYLNTIKVYINSVNYLISPAPVSRQSSSRVDRGTSMDGALARVIEANCVTRLSNGRRKPPCNANQRWKGGSRDDGPADVSWFNMDCSPLDYEKIHAAAARARGSCGFGHGS